MALVLDGDNGIVGVLATNNDGDVIFDTNTLFVDAVENKVGISTITPENALHIASSDNAQMLLQNTSTGDASIKFNRSGQTFFMGIESSDNSFRISDTGTGVGDGDRLIIDTSGNVGIGTDDPTSKLHADGAIVSTNLAQGTGELQIQGYGNTGYINMNGSGSLIFRMGSSYSEDLKLTSAGILQGASDAEIATSPIRTHSNTISTNTTIDANDNAVASGPLGIADGVTLTINGNMTVV